MKVGLLLHYYSICTAERIRANRVKAELVRSIFARERETERKGESYRGKENQDEIRA